MSVQKSSDLFEKLNNIPTNIDNLHESNSKNDNVFKKLKELYYEAVFRKQKPDQDFDQKILKFNFDPKIISPSKSQVYETLVDYRFTPFFDSKLKTNFDSKIKRSIDKQTNKNIQMIEVYRATIKRFGSNFINLMMIDNQMFTVLNKIKKITKIKYIQSCLKF